MLLFKIVDKFNILINKKLKFYFINFPNNLYQQ